MDEETVYDVSDPSLRWSELPDEVKEYFSERGKKGGETTKAKYGHDHFRRIGALGGRGNKRS